MKNPSSIALIIILAISTIASCKKPAAVLPTKSNTSKTSSEAKTDTSTQIISNTELIGNWNIVTDSSYLQGTGFYPGGDSTYHGTPADHFIFTKYGNLYVHNGFYNMIDTAVYTISNDSTVQWIDSYWSADGSHGGGPVTQGIYTITSITVHSLILTQADYIPEGWQYIRIVFKK